MKDWDMPHNFGLLIICLFILILSGISSCTTIKLEAFKNGYCEKQGISTDQTLWDKCK